MCGVNTRLQTSLYLPAPRSCTSTFLVLWSMIKNTKKRQQWTSACHVT